MVDLILLWWSGGCVGSAMRTGEKKRQCEVVWCILGQVAGSSVVTHSPCDVVHTASPSSSLPLPGLTGESPDLRCHAPALALLIRPTASTDR